MAKHYDNKNDLIRAMRETNKRSQIAEGAAWSGLMAMSLDILYREFGFRDNRLNKFIDEMMKLEHEIDGDGQKFRQVCKRLYDEAGILIEMPMYK